MADVSQTEKNDDEVAPRQRSYATLDYDYIKKMKEDHKDVIDRARIIAAAAKEAALAAKTTL